MQPQLEMSLCYCVCMCVCVRLRARVVAHNQHKPLHRPALISPASIAFWLFHSLVNLIDL